MLQRLEHHEREIASELSKLDFETGDLTLLLRAVGSGEDRTVGGVWAARRIHLGCQALLARLDQRIRAEEQALFESLEQIEGAQSELPVPRNLGGEAKSLARMRAEIQRRSDALTASVDATRKTLSTWGDQADPAVVSFLRFVTLTERHTAGLQKDTDEKLAVRQIRAALAFMSPMLELSLPPNTDLAMLRRVELPGRSWWQSGGPQIDALPGQQ